MDVDSAINAGRDPDRILDGELWPEHIIEPQPPDPKARLTGWLY